MQFTTNSPKVIYLITLSSRLCNLRCKPLHLPIFILPKYLSSNVPKFSSAKILCYSELLWLQDLTQSRSCFTFTNNMFILFMHMCCIVSSNRSHARLLGSIITSSYVDNKLYIYKCFQLFCY